MQGRHTAATMMPATFPSRRAVANAIMVFPEGGQPDEKSVFDANRSLQTLE
jgi:hypothetical protein